MVRDLSGKNLAGLQHGANIRAVPRCPTERGFGVGRVLKRSHEPLQLRRIQAMNRGSAHHVIPRHNVGERIGTRRHGVDRVVTFTIDHGQ